MSDAGYFVAGAIVGAFVFWLITTVKMPTTSANTGGVVIVPAQQGYRNPFYPGSYTPPGHIIPL